MADGVVVHNGDSGTGTAFTAATDDAGGAGQVQIIKLAISADGSATVIPADAANGLDVDVTRLPALVAGSAEIGKVGVVDAAGDRLAINADGSVNISGTVTAESSDRHDATATIGGLTTATTLYTAGDQMGTLMELTNMAATSGGQGWIGTLGLIVDKIGVVGPVRAWFFKESVTLASDNSAFSLSDADQAKCVGTIVFPSPADANNNARCTLPGVNLDYECTATSLFVAMQTLTTHTVHFDAADDLTVVARAYRL